MSVEYCPQCRTTTNMGLTVVPKETTGKDGKRKTMSVKTYHCETCRAFVRSWEEEEEFGKLAADYQK